MLAKHMHKHNAQWTCSNWSHRKQSVSGNALIINLEFLRIPLLFSFPLGTWSSIVKQIFIKWSLISLSGSLVASQCSAMSLCCSSNGVLNPVCHQRLGPNEVQTQGEHQLLSSLCEVRDHPAGLHVPLLAFYWGQQTQISLTSKFHRDLLIDSFTRQLMRQGLEVAAGWIKAIAVGRLRWCGVWGWAGEKLVCITDLRVRVAVSWGDTRPTLQLQRLTHGFTVNQRGQQREWVRQIPEVSLWSFSG